MKIEDIALSLTPKLSHRAMAHLVEIFGSAEAIYAASIDELMERGTLCEAMAKSIVSKVGFAEAKDVVKRCSGASIDILSAEDEGYPRRLRFTEEYPHIIYMVGNRSIVDRTPVCAFVGDEEGISSYAAQMTGTLVKEFAQLVPEAVVVGEIENRLSNYALHCAIDNSLRCIGVSSKPLWEVAIDRHNSLAEEILMSGGMLLSQATRSGIEGSRALHKYLVAALADGVVAVEGIKIPAVAQYADSCHRTIMALPGRVTDGMSKGTNRMLASNMAQLVTSGRDIVECLEFEECL